MRRVLIVTAITTVLSVANAFAAPSGTEATDSFTQTAGRKWYESGDFVVQGEQQRQRLEKAGFPQYDY